MPRHSVNFTNSFRRPLFTLMSNYDIIWWWIVDAAVMRQVAFGVLDQNGVELSPSWRAAYIRQTGRYFFRGGVGGIHRGQEMPTPFKDWAATTLLFRWALMKLFAEVWWTVEVIILLEVWWLGIVVEHSDAQYFVELFWCARLLLPAPQRHARQPILAPTLLVVTAAISHGQSMDLGFKLSESSFSN